MSDNGNPLHDPTDDLLAQARAMPPVAAPDFMARVLADALAVQPQPTLIKPRAPMPRRSLVSRALAALGGGFGVAGLGSVALAGMMLGYVQPDPLLSLTNAVGVTTTTVASLDLLPGFDTLLTEDMSQ